jgi:uncharacterized protein involved in exopolysaccharide biosynthesis
MNDYEPQLSTGENAEKDISLIDVLIEIGKAKWIFISFIFIAIIISVIASYFMTPTFTAKTLILPPQQQQNNAAASSLAGLGALTGISISSIGVKNTDDMYVTLMTSEDFQSKLIDRFKLKERYQCPFIVDCRTQLNAHTRIISDKKSTLMTIEVDDVDPVFAANMANAYIDELSNTLGKLAVTDAQKRRIYFENQIRKTQADLSAAEIYFQTVKQKSGLQLPSVNADINVNQVTDIHAQIASREIQLEALRLYSTPQNTDVKRLVTELTALKTHLLKIEKGSSEAPNIDNIQQEALQAYRNIKVQDSLLEAFAKQFELAKVDESKEGPLIQVVDQAKPPERRSSPKRTKLALQSAFEGLVFAIIFVFLKFIIQKTASTPAGQIRLNDLKKAWLP